MLIPLDSIERDESLQMRVKISREVVREYVEKLKRGERLPAIKVFADEAGHHWPGDGWHRLLAHDSLALPEIESDVAPGGRRAAWMYALGANGSHGLKRSRADIRKAICEALEDAELGRYSDREIGRIVGVDGKTVAKVRRELEGGQGPELLTAFRVGADGKVRKPRRSRTAEVRISAVELGNANSASRGAGAAGPLSRSMPAAGGNAGIDFNIVEAMHGLESGLAERFKGWPAEKRHAFCVALANFAKEHDPEIAQMRMDAFDEVLRRNREDGDA